MNMRPDFEVLPISVAHFFLFFLAVFPPCMPGLGAGCCNSTKLFCPKKKNHYMQNGHVVLQVSGLLVPVGTTIDLSTYAVHRDAAIYPEPHAFRPGRWLLPSDSEEVRLRGAYSFIPFLAGPRNCIGQKFAIQVCR